MSYCGLGSLEDLLQMVAVGGFPDRDALEVKYWGVQSPEIHHKHLIDRKGKQQQSKQNFGPKTKDRPREGKASVHSAKQREGSTKRWYVIIVTEETHTGQRGFPGEDLGQYLP